ncbi:hypothetical protein [Iamia sp.]|uniref:hypothetical protein n=1 Tax=Iamia sp. TaxID=2722710 RepID=UPI002CE0586A|nr:hypothetical protein [Iamia sp.]HXH55937.1 hypothetical protein [Iamia sp.]
MSPEASGEPAADPFMEYLLGPPRPPGSISQVDRAAGRVQADAMVSGRSVVLINPGQVDAFGRFLQETNDKLDAARDHLRRIQPPSPDAPPELRQVISNVDSAVGLLGTTARSLTSGSNYASRVAQLARRADEGGGLSGLGAAKAVKGLVTFAADPSLGGGVAALTKAINTAIGVDLVGRTAEVVVDTLAGARRHGLAGGGARAVVRALGAGLRGVVAPTRDFERLRDGSLPGPEASRSQRLVTKIARFAGPATVVIDTISGVGAVADMREQGLKASNGLGLGSAVTGLGSAALVFTAPWAAAGLGAISLATGGGSIVAKGKEEDAERRRAEEVWREKLRRNPNTTDVLRRDGPLLAPMTRLPPSSRPRISTIPPLPPLPRLSPTPPRRRPRARPRVDEIPPLEPLPGLSPTPP